MSDALERDRRDEQRHRDPRPEHRRLGRGRAHVAEDARPEDPAAVRLEVLPQRVFVARAAREVAERALVEPLRGEALVVGDVDRTRQERAAAGTGRRAHAERTAPRSRGASAKATTSKQT